MARRARMTDGFRPAKLVDFLEAVYDVDTDDQTWLATAMGTAREVWGRGGPMHGAIYDASDIENFRVAAVHIDGFCDRGVEHILRGRSFITPGLVTRSYRCLVAGDATPTFPEMRPMYDWFKPLGFVDTLYVNGLDPIGLGVFFGIWRQDAQSVSHAEMAVYRRMAHHLAAAHRIRRRLNRRCPSTGPRKIDVREDAEVILDAAGRVVHAVGAAKTAQALTALVETSRARDLARTSRPESTEGLRRWCPLTDVRWTLVDSYESSGARYVIARENRIEVSGLRKLTNRERQVVAYTAVGQSTKETAYALGISDSTVRVLLARARARLGARSQTELLDHPDVLPLRPGHTAGSA